ncbi:MAG: hypothetical protein V3S14_14440 [Anaerolineae bacterium]
MNRVHVECALEGANSILPDSYVPGTDVNDDDWGAAVSVGKVLLDIGPENVQEDALGQAMLERTQRWLVALLQAGALNRRERVEAGNLLARLGDPRFRSDAWYLPDEPLLGFKDS